MEGLSGDCGGGGTHAGDGRGGNQGMPRCGRLIQVQKIFIVLVCIVMVMVVMVPRLCVGDDGLVGRDG